jgi:L-threonylcarbamoyladenylate synthase
VISKDISRAVSILRSGGLVAIPTETVYGLGADATRSSAVAKIFAVKGRPAQHPLIVHIGSMDELTKWAVEIPESALLLAKTFWPGPLTIILKKTPLASEVATGGLDTIGIRVPNHPMALNLLKEFGGGVAAPSANRFSRVSPTEAHHVEEDLGSDVEMILDGGPCKIGIESTIVDLTNEQPAILRPGSVTREMLQEVLGHGVPVLKNSAVRAPGQHPKHYSPKARVIVVQENEVRAQAEEWLAKGEKVAVMSPNPAEAFPKDVLRIPISKNLSELAESLYANFRLTDALGAGVLIAVAPPASGIGLAIADRLARAANAFTD